MSEFSTLKARILSITGEGNFINLAVAKQKAGLTMIRTVADAEKVLRVLTKPRRVTPPIPLHVKQRYNEAHRLWFSTEYKAAYLDGHYSPPNFPKIHTSGGLTNYIVNHATWSGCYGNRINTTGRKIFDQKKKKEIWITGTTKTGTGDIVLCMPGGKMLWLEVKINKDTPSDKQLKQQRLVRSAGGEYLFVKTAEQYLDIFDGYKYGS